ncbi:MAG: DUF3299 domain-containing protein [Vibrio sp.]
MQYSSLNQLNVTKQFFAKFCFVALCLFGVFNSFQAHAESENPLKLDWIDLVPVDEQKNFDKLGMPAPGGHKGGPAKQNPIGHTRPELNNSFVKIPGFVIPLEGDENTITEFLLVPYFGACIHVPPPPPNQIIYVKFPKGAPVQELWDVVYVIGTLKTEVLAHDLAETGYSLDGVKIEEYDDQ